MITSISFLKEEIKVMTAQIDTFQNKDFKLYYDLVIKVEY